MQAGSRRRGNPPLGDAGMGADTRRSGFSGIGNSSSASEVGVKSVGWNGIETGCDAFRRSRGQRPVRATASGITADNRAAISS